MNYLITKYKALAFQVFRAILGGGTDFKRRLNQMIKIFYLLSCLPFEVVGDLLSPYNGSKMLTRGDPKKILIIRVDQLGDVLSSTLLLPGFKSKYPEIEIHYLVNKKANDLLSKNPFVDRIYFWEDPMLFVLFGREKRTQTGLLSTLKSNRVTLSLLKKEHYDAVLNARPMPPSSNIPWRQIGSQRLIVFNTSEQSFLADVVCNYDFGKDEWENYLKLSRALEVNVSDMKSEAGFFNFDDSFIMRNNLLEANFGFVVISPITFDTDKLWAMSNWRAILKLLSEKGVKVVLTGIGSQRKYLDEMAFGFDAERIKIAAEISIPMLARLIKSSMLFIGIDSFPAILAAMLRKEMICLVNERNYYVKGLSRSILVNRKCLLPLFENVHVFSTRSSAESILNAVRLMLN